MRAENEQWTSFFYAHRGSLIIALILKVGVKSFLKIYPRQVAFFN